MKKMKKLMLALVAMAFIAFGYTPGASAAGMNSCVAKGPRDVLAWTGKAVKNTQGEELGRLDDFVRDTGGEISLAVMTEAGSGREIAVPFEALSFNKSENHVVLSATREQLANEPALGQNQILNNRAFIEEVYRYFGERPYWSGEGSPRGYFGSGFHGSAVVMDHQLEMMRDF